MTISERGAGWFDPQLEGAARDEQTAGRPAFRRLIERLLADRRAVAVLRWLMLANAIFAAFHLLRFLLLRLEVAPGSVFVLDSFSLSMEWGYAEIFNYLQTLALVALLAGIALRTRQALYLCWAVVFLLVAVDDALAIHQQFGSLLAAVVPLSPQLGLRPADLGESAAWLGGAVGIAALLAFGFRRAMPLHREMGWYFALTFGLLLLFGFGVDMLHSLLNGTFFASSLVFELIEDGGEMVSISIALALAVAVWHLAGEPATGANPAESGPVLDRIRRHGGL